MGLEEHRQQIRSIIDDPTLTYRQRVHALAGAAENVLDPPTVGPGCAMALDKGLVCDLAEGHAPYRPRYTLPDYAKAIQQGSASSSCHPRPPSTRRRRSCSPSTPTTGYPVWFGDIDRLLGPFADDLDDGELRARLRHFWVLLDRPVVVSGFRHHGTRRRARVWAEAAPDDLARVADGLLAEGVREVRRRSLPDVAVAI